MRLINKTILYYLLISFPLLIIAGFFSYFLIKGELQDGVDESLAKERLNAIHLINSFSRPQSVNASFDSLSGIKLAKNEKAGEVFSDTSIYDTAEQEFVPYRVLKSYYRSNSNNYLITIAKASFEQEELMEGLLSAFVLIIAFLVAAFFIVNWLISKALWKPFHKTLSELGTYDIRKHDYHKFESVNTAEFNELNIALSKMTEKIHSDFLQQKEFTENASHEMQTPLAIAKANLSLLMQSSNLKEEEMDQLQTIENTLKKLSALNKSLILLTKIENNQFHKKAAIDLKEITVKALENYSDLIQAKNLKIETGFSAGFTIEMNPVLADVLISNLLQNAIRHNKAGGVIQVSSAPNTFSISNSGEPLTIHEEELFVRFKKNDASKDSLGLGLSIVKTIISHYNHTIAYSYTDGKHTFTITHP
ncbi:MAG: hypothetical protein JWO09_3054 [Bacteroidetes bacterium]|nr:hypothetical protein [Bacteroidota bacterium]